MKDKNYDHPGVKAEAAHNQPSELTYGELEKVVGGRALQFGTYSTDPTATFKPRRPVINQG